ncbi:helix-turn-helix domain-containing protein [Oecophyllibacter saccharovorans]|uniref:helix-turn-helix domain-containing protein n=1 Tax=Oecophyllibacter saccharovorans TaxID=2558360 RepID=UPI0011729720|nr:helix-turn-helix domain-containing protein [Oecophyllibacter saccharovorans]TPW36609.1 helix-turn-helix domain-containing protein [Oecophyllibacter saccharovorans]
MSFAAMNWAWKQADLSSTQMLVLIALAHHANEGGEAWPAVARLMEMTRLSERSVRASITALRAKGVLSRPGGKCRSEVRLNLGRVPGETGGAAGPAGAGHAGRGASRAARPAPAAPELTGTDTEPSIILPPAPRAAKPSAPPKTTALVTQDLPEWLPLAAWEGWLEMRRQARKPPTPRAIALTLRQLQALREQGQDVEAVLDQSTQRGWVGVFPVRRGDGAGGSGRPEVRGRTDFSDLVAGFDAPITDEMEDWQREALRQAGVVR